MRAAQEPPDGGKGKATVLRCRKKRSTAPAVFKISETLRVF